MAVLLALAAAAFSGSGDFLGGLASRRGRVMGVVLVNHLAGAVVVLAAAPLVGGSLDAGALWWGSVAGLSGAGGVVALYGGFTRSSMAVVSPIAAVGAAVWPVLFDLARGRDPGPVVLLGVVAGITAIWTLSSTGRLGGAAHVREGVLFGMLAGLGFGTLLIFLSLGSGEGIWALVPARVSGSLVMAAVVAATRTALPRGRESLAPSIGAGVLVTIGNSLFVLAAARGSLAVVSVLAAMFPAATVVLAWLVLGERLTRRHQAGLALALVAVGLVAGG
ncbi:MAG: DMT family transporter [Actinobacteria bacterium]|nr:DMT family transporter [Actinomycetota bacterium]